MSADSDVKTLFPSWSWIAWVPLVWLPIPSARGVIVPNANLSILQYGKAQDALYQECMTEHIPEVRCWWLWPTATSHKDGLYELKSSAGTKFHGQHNISNVNEKSVLRPWKPEENPEVKFQALISSLFNALSYIWFWTSVAKFSIHWDPSCIDMGFGTYEEDGELIYNRVTPSIVDANRCVVGKLGSQLRPIWDLWHKSTTVLHDFVLVASFDLPNTQKSLVGCA